MSTINQLHSTLLFIFASSRTISFFLVSHLILYSMEQKVKVKVELDIGKAHVVTSEQY